MAKVSLKLKVENAKFANDAGVDNIDFSVDTEYTTEELLAIMQALPAYTASALELVERSQS